MKNFHERNLARKLRRARSELKYFSNLLKDMSRENELYASEWLSDFNFITDSLGLDSIVKSPSTKMRTFKNSDPKVPDETQELPGDNLSGSRPEWAKKLYREIAKISHPDKNIESENTKRMSEIFQKASEAFGKESFNSLIDIALDLDIPVEIPNQILLEKMEDRIKSAKKEISEIENSPSWLWGESLGLDDIRIELLKKILDKKFGTQVEREKILNVLDVLNNT